MAAGGAYPKPNSASHVLPGEFVYKGVLFCNNYPLKAIQRIESDLQFNDDDVMVVTYPKSGTTWMQEIVFLVENNADVEQALAKPLNARFPFLDIAKNWHENEKGEFTHIVENMPGPRLMKSHLSRSYFDRVLRSKDTKFIIVNRNPKDVLVSYYYFYRMNRNLGDFQGYFDDFFELAKMNMIAQGDWFDWVLSWWEERDNPNVLIMTYEEMSRDLPKAVRKVAAFLGKAPSDDDVSKICGHVSFDNMRNNPQTNASQEGHYKVKESAFIRKGQVGDWKNHMSREQNDHIDKLFEEKIKPTGMSFEFE